MAWKFDGQVLDLDAAGQTRLGIQAPGVIQLVVFLVVGFLERGAALAHMHMAGGAGGHHFAGVFDGHTGVEQALAQRGAALDFQIAALGAQHGVGQQGMGGSLIEKLGGDGRARRGVVAQARHLCLKIKTYLVRIGEIIMQTWQMQEAKAHMSELIQRAGQLGPQEITVHGRSVAVVLSREAFDRLAGASGSLVDFMRQSPLCGLDEIVFERDTSLTREISQCR